MIRRGYSSDALLLLFTVLAFFAPIPAELSSPYRGSSQYHAGPLYANRRMPYRQAAPSNDPRPACPETRECLSAVRQLRQAMRRLRAKRKEVSQKVFNIVNDDSGTDLTAASAELSQLIEEEDELTATVLSVRAMGRENGCEGCGQMTREGVEVIRPSRLLARECGKLERMSRANRLQLLIAGRMKTRILLKLANQLRGEFPQEERERLRERLAEIRTREQDLMTERDALRSKVGALGC